MGDINAAAETIRREIKQMRMAVSIFAPHGFDSSRPTEYGLADDLRQGFDRLEPALDALVAALSAKDEQVESLRAEKEDAISAIGEYSEGLIEPGDLAAAVDWLIQEDSRLRRQCADDMTWTELRQLAEQLRAERDAAEATLEATARWGAKRHEEAKALRVEKQQLEEQVKELQGRLKLACEPCAECGHVDWRELDDVLDA